MPSPVGWRDLREWLALIERNGQLQRIGKPVDADEELAAITYMATRRENAPALLFENIAGDRSGSSVLANMLGSSKERYALAVGLDPDSVDRRDDRGNPRHHEPADRAGARSRKPRRRSTRSCCAATTSTSPHFPAPKFWPGDGGRYIGTGDITFTASARHRPHQCRLLPADAARPAPRRALLLARQARRCSTARPGGSAASPARSSPPTASIRCCSCWPRRCSARRNPSSTSPAA